MGVIFRTASEDRKIRHFMRDLHLLLDRWEKIQQEGKQKSAPCLLYQEPNIVGRTVRDFLTEDIDRVLVDNPSDYEHILEVVRQIAPRSQSKIQLFNEPIPIFERFNVESQIEQTFLKRVPLPSGGEIVVEETEALTVIDVNTSSHKGMEKGGVSFILQANLEAAREIVRQLRLRDIGGIIVVDFIDMKSMKDRRTLHQFMLEELTRDKSKTHVSPVSQLGLMQISRQRHQESSLSRSYDVCPYCNGEGTLKSPYSLHMAIQRRLVSQLYAQKKLDHPAKVFEIQLHPIVWSYIRSHGQNNFSDIEKKWEVECRFSQREDFHVETFTVVPVK
jgi:ribonuclease G